MKYRVAVRIETQQDQLPMSLKSASICEGGDSRLTFSWSVVDRDKLVIVPVKERLDEGLVRMVVGEITTQRRRSGQRKGRTRSKVRPVSRTKQWWPGITLSEDRGCNFGKGGPNGI